MNLAAVQYTNPLSQWLWESGVAWLFVVALAIVAIIGGGWLAFDAWRARRRKRRDGK